MISVIMPLYNAEKYLEETLTSILNQTFSDYELICINDASTDKTIEILEKYEKLDNRIVHYTNVHREGAAFSRNFGMKIASGDYLCFLDGDDIFDSDLLYLANKTAGKYNLDVVLFEAVHVESENIYEKKIIKRSEAFKNKYYKNTFNLNIIDYDDVLSWTNGPWNKLFSKSFVKKNKIEFQSLQSSNDVYFVEMAFIYAERVRFIDDERVMVYVRDHDVATRISFSRNPFCTYEAAEKLLQELDVRNGTDNMLCYAYIKMFFALIGGLKKCKNEKDKKSFYAMLHSEGIDNVLKINSWINDKREILNLYSKFKANIYESGWFEEYNVLDYKLDKVGANLVDRFLGNNTIIWGAGNFGMALLRYLKHKDINIENVVDRDENKIGKMIDGYEVKDAYEYDYAYTNTIIVSSNKAYGDVLRYLKDYDTVIINLCEVMDV